MAKFHGEVGYAESIEIANGEWEDRITKRMCYGDVTRNTRRLDNGEKINNDLTVNNSISIVADAYARDHFFAMRYVKWMGVRWIVSDVEVAHPRLILKLGGVYNGPTE